MCSKVNYAYSRGPSDGATPDNSAPVEIAFATVLTSIPMPCGDLLSDDAFESLACCDPSGLAANVDRENDYLPPLSSSPPENTPSSPRSAFSDEEGSVQSFMSSSPFDTPHLPGSLARNTDEFSQRVSDLEFTPLKNGLVKSGPIYTPNRTCWSSRSPAAAQGSCVLDFSRAYPRTTSVTGSPDEFLRFSTALHGQVDADNHSPSAFEGQKTFTKTSMERPQGGGLLPSPDSTAEISPISFTSNSENQKLSCPSTIHQSPLYRLIKRARSYNNPHLEEPFPKKAKIHFDSTSDYSRRLYAPRTASLRRAESLRTTTSDLESFSQSGNLSVNPAPPKSEVPARPPRQRRAKKKVIPHPVPIIAPPENYAVGLPVSAESLAITRLKKFLERELDQRAEEGFAGDFFYAGRNAMRDADSLGTNMCSTWEGALGIGRERRVKTINWLLNVKPAVSEPPVSPEPPCLVSTPTVSPGSSSPSCVSVGDPTEVVYNLLDQLQTSHETRFHACWMFLRYFYLVMSPESFKFPERVSSRPESLNSDYATKLERRGRELIILDISVASLSLSVKFHRDFLDPLLPVYAHEYLALSPHGMSYDDLETAHRDVLSAFRYRLGVSPQSLMDELWFALPSLRELLCFERGWSKAMEHAWTVLFRAVREADVQMFCVSLLTTVAIMDGVIQSLVHRDRCGRPGPITSCPDVSKQQARKVAGDVLCEIQALVGVSDIHVRICRLWMEKFEES